jgi:hypothetical protein
LTTLTPASPLLEHGHDLFLGVLFGFLEFLMMVLFYQKTLSHCVAVFGEMVNEPLTA